MTGIVRLVKNSVGPEWSIVICHLNPGYLVPWPSTVFTTSDELQIAVQAILDTSWEELSFDGTIEGLDFERLAEGVHQSQDDGYQARNEKELIPRFLSLVVLGVFLTNFDQVRFVRRVARPVYEVDQEVVTTPATAPAPVMDGEMEPPAA